LYRDLEVDSGNLRTSTYHIAVTFCTPFGSNPDALWAFAWSRAIVLASASTGLSESPTVGAFKLSEPLKSTVAAMVQSGSGLVVPVVKRRVLVLVAQLVRALAWV